MSPQLNRMIYGFSPSSWVQHLRGDGYRPVVFLEHGLRLGIFLAIALIATAGYQRLAEPKQRGLLIGALLWLLVTLILTKTLGALLIAFVLLPLVLFFGVRTQLLAAAVLAGIVLTYPMLRAVDLVPTERILGFIGSISSENRVGSLGYRFLNEDLLLEKANQRPLFGWGGWGRARAFDERGGGGGATDGVWVIEFGERGWVGYLARFGLLTIPTILLALRRRNEDISLATAVLSMALAANLVDLLPNSSLTPLTWLMAGSLAGRLEKRTVEDEPQPGAHPPPAGGKHLPYRRQLPQGRAPAFRREEQSRPLRSQESSVNRSRRS